MGYMKPTTSTAVITASGLQSKTKARIGQVTITPGTETTTIIIYDSKTTATGSIVFKKKMTANTDSKDFPQIPSIMCENGIYVDITGAGAEVLVYTL